MRFIQQTKSSTTSEKHTRTTVERSFFNFVFLNFLNIRKEYYKLQQFALEPPTQNDTVSFRELVSFLQKHFFSNTFKKTKVVWKF